MFSSKSRAERTASQAWDYLSSAMAAATEKAREAGEQTAELADRTGRRSHDLADLASRKGHKLAKRAGKKSNKLAARASKQSHRLAGSADEAWSRANLAASVLAGNKPGRPWGLIAGVALLGVALGWAAATASQTAISREAEEEERELDENAIVVTPVPEN